MWFFFALLSAIFAALTSILAKIGIEGVPSNLATAIRTVVVILMAWAMVFLLCYYKALQMGNATEVSAVDKFSLVITLVLAFFFLQDVLTFKTIIGCILITIGTLVMIL